MWIMNLLFPGIALKVKGKKIIKIEIEREKEIKWKICWEIHNKSPGQEES